MSEGLSDAGSLERIQNANMSGVSNSLAGAHKSSVMSIKKEDSTRMDAPRRFAILGRKHCEKGSTSLGDDYQNISSPESSNDFGVSELTSGSNRAKIGCRSQVRASLHLGTIGKLHS